MFDRIKDTHWYQSRIVSPLKGYKVTKELALQLFWTLEGDLNFYCSDKDIELDFQFDTYDYTIDILVKEPGYIINKRLKDGELDSSDLKIECITYTEVLWCILNYETVLDRARDRIDEVCEILSLRDN